MSTPDREPFWHIQLAVLVALGLYVILPGELTYGLKPAVVAFEVLLLLGLIFTTSQQQLFRSRRRRVFTVAMIAAITVSNLISLERLAYFLITGGDIKATELIGYGMAIYATNVLIFAMWYWELDGGGPVRRRRPDSTPGGDFLFPQQSGSARDPHWQPTFPDYLYLAATNAMNLAPADTVPLSVRAKTLMGLQAVASLTIIVLVVARAVSLLGT